MAAPDCQRVFQHAYRHVRIVGALQFDMEQAAAGRLPQQIDARFADAAEFHVAPTEDSLGRPRQQAQRSAGEIRQDLFQSGVVFGPQAN